LTDDLFLKLSKAQGGAFVLAPMLKATIPKTAYGFSVMWVQTDYLPTLTYVTHKTSELSFGDIAHTVGA